MAFFCLLSILSGQTTPVRAHEITPAIVDMSFHEDQVSISLEINAEAVLADIDLSTTSNTDDAENSARYDELRSLTEGELIETTTENWGRVRDKLFLKSMDQLLVIELKSVEVEPVNDPELPRLTKVTATAELPALAKDVTYGWDASLGLMVLRVGNEADQGFAGYIEPGKTSPPIPIANWKAQSPWLSFVSFIPVGFDHILPKGLDHILFVIGIYLLSPKLKPLLWQISAFTVAHTITLALGALDIVRISPSIVEPLIAISIAYIAIENILSAKTAPWRIGLIFAFGLLHGLGFASVLMEFGLPQQNFVPALLGFNVGVEVGQLTVVVICFGTLGYWFGKKQWYRRIISIPISAVIAGVGLWWAVERVI